MDFQQEYDHNGWDFDLLNQSWLDLQANDFVDFGAFPDYPYTLDFSSMMMDQASAVPDVTFPGIEPSTSSDLSVSYEVGQESGAQSMAVSSAPSVMPTSLEPSSTKVTQDVAANSSDSPAKPKLEDFLLEFELPQAIPITPGRRPYRPKERKKVERVRKVGACLRCRILKIPVGFRNLLEFFCCSPLNFT
jgi:hypothetical protein